MTAAAAEAEAEAEAQQADQDREQRSNHIETPQNFRTTEVTWNRVKLEWDEPTASDITHVKLLRTGTRLSDTEFVITNGNNHITDAGLIPVSTYTYTLSFGTSATTYGPTATVSATTLIIPEPTNLQFVQLEYDTVLISWDNISDTRALTTSVERTGLVGDATQVHHTTLRSTYADTATLTEGVEYTYEIYYRTLAEDGTYHGGTDSGMSDANYISATIPGPPVLTMAHSSADDGDPLTFTLYSTLTSNQDINVDYATSIEQGDTAEANDFQPKSGTLTISAGDTSASFQVMTAGSDDLYEDDESFTVTLSNADRGTLATQSVSGTIMETNDLPELNIETAFHTRDESNASNYSLLVLITPRAEYGFDFRLDISGSAGNEDDYALVPSTYTIGPEQNRYSIQINVIEDNLYEGYEDAIFHLQVDPALATVGEDDTFTLTITDNDPAPTLRATLHQPGTEGSQNQGTEPVPGQDFANVVFKLHLQGRYATDISVNVEAIDGTAEEGLDYRLNTTSVTFTGSQAVHYIKVPVIDNADFGGGGSKNFQLQFSSADDHFIPPNPVLVTGYVKDNEDPPEGVDYVPEDITTAAAIGAGESLTGVGMG